MAGQILRTHLDFNVGYTKQLFFGGFAIRLHLPLVLALEFRVTQVSQTARRFKRHNSHSLAGLSVQESSRQLAIIEKLQISFPQSCAGHGFHSVGQPAIYLDPDD